MIDQLIIGEVHSYDDFDATVAERRIGKPKKKRITESVPFSNITHDFSAINGEVYWEDRTLEYVFEIIADSAEELEEKKQPFVSWIMNVMNERLYDPFIPDYHFLATFDDIDDDDSEIEKSVITVKFTAYPYMIANEPRTVTVALPKGTFTSNPITIKFVNESSHIIIPTLKLEGRCTIETSRNGYVPYQADGETIDEAFKLDVGENVWRFTFSLLEETLTVQFYEEVF